MYVYTWNKKNDCNILVQVNMRISNNKYKKIKSDTRGIKLRITVIALLLKENFYLIFHQ